MVLRLQGGAVDLLDDLSPFLLKIVRLNSAIVKGKDQLRPIIKDSPSQWGYAWRNLLDTSGERNLLFPL